jgi:hypothetical protein
MCKKTSLMGSSGPPDEDQTAENNSAVVDTLAVVECWQL